MKKFAMTGLLGTALLSFTLSIGFSAASANTGDNYTGDKEPGKKRSEKTISRGDALRVSHEESNEQQAVSNETRESKQTATWGDCTQPDFDKN